MSNSKKFLWIIGMIVLGAGFISLYIFATMSLWNWLVPEIFDGPVIGFGQTAGLMLLVCMFSWIAIGGKHGHHHHHDRMHWKKRWKNKWKHRWDKDWCNMSEEERAEWKRNFKETGNAGNEN